MLAIASIGLSACWADNIEFGTTSELGVSDITLFLNDQQQQVDSVVILSEIIEITIPTVDNNFPKMTAQFFLPNEETVTVIFAGFSEPNSNRRCMDIKTYGELDGFCLPEESDLFTGQVCEFSHMSYSTSSVEYGSAFEGQVFVSACQEDNDRISLVFDGGVKDDSDFNAPVIPVRGQLNNIRYQAQ